MAYVLLADSHTFKCRTWDDPLRTTLDRFIPAKYSRPRGTTVESAFTSPGREEGPWYDGYLPGEKWPLSLRLLVGLPLLLGLGLLLLIGGALGLAVAVMVAVIVLSVVPYLIDALFGTGDATYYVFWAIGIPVVLVFGVSFLLGLLPGKWGDRLGAPAFWLLDDLPAWANSRLVSPVVDRVGERLSLIGRVLAPRKPLAQWQREDFSRITRAAFMSNPQHSVGRISIVFEQDQQVIHPRDWRRASKRGQVPRYGVFVMSWRSKGPSSDDADVEREPRDVWFTPFNTEWDALEHARAQVRDGREGITFNEIPWYASWQYVDRIRCGVHTEPYAERWSSWEGWVPREDLGSYDDDRVS